MQMREELQLFGRLRIEQVLLIFVLVLFTAWFVQNLIAFIGIGIWELLLHLNLVSTEGNDRESVFIESLHRHVLLSVFTPMNQIVGFLIGLCVGYWRFCGYKKTILKEASSQNSEAS